jgi:hypothetical protein
MEKPCQKMLNLMEVLSQLKSQGGDGDAHHAQRIQRILSDVASGRMTPEDAIKEAKRLKISTF